jgi:hypothetical protein
MTGFTEPTSAVGQGDSYRAGNTIRAWAGSAVRASRTARATVGSPECWMANPSARLW